MKYAKLSLTEVRTALRDVADDARSTFGSLDELHLNWQPDAARWSIAQCFDHLRRGNELLLESAEAALNSPPRSLWQRVPMLSAIFGWALIRSQGPRASGKFTAPARAQPTTSRIGGDIIQRFVDQHRRAEEWTRGLDPRVASRTIMISPFISIVTYSVLDGLRLLVAHDRRHFEQARRVMLLPNFAH